MGLRVWNYVPLRLRPPGRGKASDSAAPVRPDPHEMFLNDQNGAGPVACACQLDNLELRSDGLFAVGKGSGHYAYLQFLI